MQTTAGPAAPPRAEPDVVEADDAEASRPWWPGVAAVAAVVAGGAGLRFLADVDLWLDEALSVNIARLPLGSMLEALRSDGHPPLYYVLLHFWIQLFGEGNVAVRSLSGVFAVATLPLMWVAGRRYGGRAAATAALVLLASSPYAVRYATEARMYSLVTFLVVAGWLAVRRAIDRPSLGRLALVSLVSGLLLLTHYWSFYFLAAVGLLLLVTGWRAGTGAVRERALRVVGALAAGGILFLPWLPGFLAQASTTGTPWGQPARPADVVMISLGDFGGGAYGEAVLLGVSLAVLALIALLARPVDRDRIEIDLRTRPAARPEWVVVAGTLVIAILASYATASAFASRYMAVLFPLFLLLAALGTTVFLRPGVRRALLVGLVVVGLVFSVRNVTRQRTQAGQLAAAIVSGAGPDDVVAFCPDQLGPAVSRLLPGSLEMVTFPSLTGPQRVDWVDYEERMAAGDPAAFARAVDQRAGAGAVWLVYSPGYRTLDRKCERTAIELELLRGARDDVVEGGLQFERGWLSRFPARPPAPAP